jgi:hypothetical protein
MNKNAEVNSIKAESKHSFNIAVAYTAFKINMHNLKDRNIYKKMQIFEI